MRRALFTVGLAVNATLFILVSIIIRVRHPELTETQLLGRYWLLYLANIGAVVGCLYELRDDE